MPNPDPTQQYFEQTKALYGNELFVRDEKLDIIMEDGSLGPKSLSEYSFQISECMKCGLGEKRDKFVLVLETQMQIFYSLGKLLANKKIYMGNHL